MVNNSGKNTTAFNRTKQPRLSSEHHIAKHATRETRLYLESLLNLHSSKRTILYNIGCELLGDTKNPHALTFLEEYRCPQIILPIDTPRNEFDLLGIVYQFLNSKLENLTTGSFYTGPAIANDIVADLDFSCGQTICDPACGSGALLFTSAAAADQLVGIDFDPIAVMLAKFNYFIKFPEGSAPRIYQSDFFAWRLAHPELKFDYVIGNPPYGADLTNAHIFGSAITSGESFSHFIETGFEMLNGELHAQLRYIVPEALLNVTRHRDIRKLILNEMGLQEIKCYSAKFAGVMSDIYRIDISNRKTVKATWVTPEGEVNQIPTSLFYSLKDNIFARLTDMDIAIINKVRARCETSLVGSIFGLGVVTGDNKSMLHAWQIHGSEPIFTGKEMAPFELRPARNYLVFDRARLQQVAPDEIYRAPVKLVYKTISTLLTVAIDYTGALTSNSANIVIPRTPNSIESIAALLNSSLYSFLNIKLFGGVNKIARANLEALPIPVLSEMDSLRIKKMVLAGNYSSAIEYIHRAIFELNNAEIDYLNKIVVRKEITSRQEQALAA